VENIKIHSKFDKIILKTLKESLQTGNASQVPDIEKIKNFTQSTSKEPKEKLELLIKQIQDSDKKRQEDEKKRQEEMKKQTDEMKKIEMLQKNILSSKIPPEQNISSQINKPISNFDNVLANIIK
jgi:hypothetical protein